MKNFWGFLYIISLFFLIGLAKNNGDTWKFMITGGVLAASLGGYVDESINNKKKEIIEETIEELENR